MRPYSEALRSLRAVGLRPTRQRLALAKILFDGQDRHVTAESVHRQAVGNNVRVSLATIYNTLHQFTGLGLLREVVVDQSRSYFDTNTSDHHHFYFENSGRLADVSGDQIAFARLPDMPAGTRLKGVDVVIRLDDGEA